LREAPVLIFLDDLHGRRVVRTTGNLGFEALDALIDVEAQIFGIGSDEADRVSPPRKRLKAVFFEGFQMVAADFEYARHGRQVVATPQPGRSQVLPDRFKRCIEVPGYFP
jgi:hypothetical protein